MSVWFRNRIALARPETVVARNGRSPARKLEMLGLADNGFEKRRGIGLVVAKRQVDRRRDAGERPARDGRRQQVAGIERHQRDPARRGDERHRHRETVDEVVGGQINAESGAIGLRHRPEGG